MSLDWNDQLAVGHPLIDQQHRELFARFNAFITACNHRRGPEELVELLNFLDAYVQSHFAAEEALMAANAYPERAAHGEQHRRFIGKLAELRAELDSCGPTVGVLVRTSKALVFWLTEHIRAVDARLAGFLPPGDHGAIK